MATAKSNAKDWFKTGLRWKNSYDTLELHVSIPLYLSMKTPILATNDYWDARFTHPEVIARELKSHLRHSSIEDPVARALSFIKARGESSKQFSQKLVKRKDGEYEFRAVPKEPNPIKEKLQQLATGQSVEIGYPSLYEDSAGGFLVQLKAYSGVVESTTDTSFLLKLGKGNFKRFRKSKVKWLTRVFEELELIDESGKYRFQFSRKNEENELKRAKLIVRFKRDAREIVLCNLTLSYEDERQQSLSEYNELAPDQSFTDLDSYRDILHTLEIAVAKDIQSTDAYSEITRFIKRKLEESINL